MAEIVKKISPTLTLKSMQVGNELEIKNTQIKAAIVRSAATRLNSEGYSFYCTDKDLPSSIKVTRLK